ncbi:ABC transporter ATP-binding protein [Aeromicrobium sp. CTD01-1L150]|uniref:ABC transporter ATP-binding protein n=1 Tax=Aeromicrobium sp. CTD01-1L150 TaxID=3341830 RepID=UPI0035BF7E57
MRKRFGSVLALDAVDLRVEAGEVVGFLGPNGAGKSTSIRALLGQLKLDAGRATLFGFDAWRQSVQAHDSVAYVPGDVSLWPGLTGGECIDLLGALQGKANATRRSELVERFDFDPTKRTGTYSKGNRQKVALIAALSTDAELLLLDEPTSGLDPLMEAQFQAVVRERVDAGAAVLLSSHIMSEVEALCEQVAIIKSGRIVRSGTLAELRSEAASSIEATTTARIAGLETQPGITAVHTREEPHGVHTSFRVEPARLNAVVSSVLAYEPATLTVQPPTLDELFQSHYRSEDS